MKPGLRTGRYARRSRQPFARPRGTSVSGHVQEICPVPIGGDQQTIRDRGERDLDAWKIVRAFDPAPCGATVISAGQVRPRWLTEHTDE
jgi:hypothetical protein